MLMIKTPLKGYIDESGHIVPDLRQKDFSLPSLGKNIIHNIHSKMHKMVILCVF